MRIIKTAKYRKLSQMTGLNGPIGEDNPSSDDLGLSGDYVVDEEDFSSKNENKYNPKEIGIYYSITSDVPVGPFKSGLEAKKNFDNHFLKLPEEQSNLDFWKKNTEFFVVIYGEDNLQREDLGNYFEIDNNYIIDYGPYDRYRSLVE